PMKKAHKPRRSRAGTRSASKGQSTPRAVDRTSVKRTLNAAAPKSNFSKRNDEASRTNRHEAILHTEPDTATQERVPMDAAELESTALESTASDASAERFPIVGIGASAGGLEALERFLKEVPERSGMAFVIVQHLDPAYKGAMVSLLQRATQLPIVQIRDRQKVEPDHVYLIPPGKDLSIMRGRLHLLAQVSRHGVNLPIDFFFRALAEDQRERSIGVVLSGMGSDGTLGLRAIKEKAGAAFVQSLESAKFGGMPRSAIDAGIADVVAPVEELPAKLVGYSRHAAHIARPEEPIAAKAKSAIEKVFLLLRAHTGNDFSVYKSSTIHRRIERRMGLHQIDKIANYVRYLREQPREVELLFRELLIGVTSFFRDPETWLHLRNKLLPALLSARPSGAIIRAWVPGCSTG